MPVLVLVPADCARSYANLEIARPLLGQGYRRAANILRSVSLGRHSNERVSDVFLARSRG